ncbi:SDR family oxidoreductase [Mycobacterium sp. NAZ190054]|uniref:SDR family oxidoreductase n=1 Tax=Mycobacterium sp. NAZ190054 TaxID=1747766 RepID=UPI0007971BC7|nr:SDR family oxidoreductase [Mycobacterium sp. NAZ190054]KWX67232.1 3-beta hydroxysteroid dehydrogenase [Mycobacterium sp. NAZ190054]
MNIFVTGASGFIGSAVVAELLAHGHHVVGLARSESAAQRVAASGAVVLRGGLDEPEILMSGASAADAVIHLAFHHDFTEYDVANRLERQAIATLGDALAGSDRALVVASGMAGLGQEQILTEDHAAPPDAPRGSEAAVFALTQRGVRTAAVRLAPTVHGAGDHGFVPTLIGCARSAGVSLYPGDGSNRWPAVHRLDAAALFRIAAEDAPAGTVLHAVAEDGIPVRQIAEAIGAGLGLPVESTAPAAVAQRAGFVGAVFGLDLAASSEKTRARFGWQPTHEGLLDDLAHTHYFAAPQS